MVDPAPDGRSSATRRLPGGCSWWVIVFLSMNFLCSGVMLNHLVVVGHWLDGTGVHPEDFDIYSRLQQARARTVAANDLRRTSVGVMNYAEAFQGRLPGGTFDPRGRGLHGWPTHILPYLWWETDDVDLDTPWNEGRNVKHYRKRIRMFQCQDVDAAYDAEGFALIHFAANGQVMGGNRSRSLKDIRSVSTTLLIGEAAGKYVPRGWPWNWRDPALGINRSPDGFGTTQRRGALCGFADGSVRFVTESAAPETFSPPEGPPPED